MPHKGMSDPPNAQQSVLPRNMISENNYSVKMVLISMIIWDGIRKEILKIKFAYCTKSCISEY